MPSPTEIRAFPLGAQFRAETDGKHMVGLVAPYDQPADVGPFTETLRKGVFSKSIRQAARELPLHVMHKHDEFPVGKAVTWKESDEGLIGDFLFDSRSAAQEAARLVEEGYLTALSVGFLPMEPHGTRWDMSGSKPHAERIEARMLETSLCSVPVYAGAGVLTIRSLGIPGKADIPTPSLNDAKAWLESLRK